MKRLGLVLGSLVLGVPAFAEGWQVLIGPPSLGQGGSNPVSLPPLSPVDWQVTYLGASNRETVISLVPGILYGQRFRKGRFYTGLGGGLLFAPSGLGLGGYSAFGFESEPIIQHVHFNLEYRQVIGYGSHGPQFPYTFRLGMTYAF